MSLSTEQGLSFWLALGTIVRGWALAEQGQAEEGIAQIHEGLAAYRATGAGGWQPYFLVLLAEVDGKGGQTEEGLAVLAEALAMVESGGERMMEAELYRLYGELSLRAGETSNGERAKSLRSSPSPDLPVALFVSRGMFPQSHRHFPQAASQIPRTARGDEPGPATPTTSPGARNT